jgi:hypothetical protein
VSAIETERMIVGADMSMGELVQLKADAERELATAKEQREHLSLDALAGVDQAAEELVRVEAEIAALERRIVLASLATAERTRRERVEEERVEREARAQASREAQEAAVNRQRELNAVRAQLASLSAAVKAFLAAEDELQNCSSRAGIHFQPLSESVALLTVISLRDSGLHGDDVFQWIPAAYRKKLLERFPESDLDHGPEPPLGRSAQCAVCTHKLLAEVEAALAEGVPLRELEERYGLSRSSLSRHRKHTETAPA